MKLKEIVRGPKNALKKDCTTRGHFTRWNLYQNHFVSIPSRGRLFNTHPPTNHKIFFTACSSLQNIFFQLGSGICIPVTILAQQHSLLLLFELPYFKTSLYNVISLHNPRTAQVITLPPYYNGCSISSIPIWLALTQSSFDAHPLVIFYF